MIGNRRWIFCQFKNKNYIRLDQIKFVCIKDKMTKTKKKKLKVCVDKVRAAANAFNVVGKILQSEPKYFRVGKEFQHHGASQLRRHLFKMENFFSHVKLLSLKFVVDFFFRFRKKKYGC